MKIFEPSAELERARPRGLRPEIPQPLGTQTIPFSNQFGRTPLSPVSEGQVLGLPAAWASVNKIANGVAMMSPLKAYASDGATELEPCPPVVARPNATYGVFDFWHLAIACAVMRGNFVGLLADYGPDGYARQVVPINPDIAYAYYGPDPYKIYEGNGFLNYIIGGQIYGALDVVHVRGFSLPGVAWGIGVVENFRRALGASLEQQHLVADVYRRGSIPPGVLTIDRPNPEPKQTKQVQDDWIEAHASDGRPAVLPKDWKFDRLTWSPEDLQFLQSRMFSIAEMALMFLLDPSDLGSSLVTGAATQTYANIEQRQISRVVDGYGHWMRRFEEAWSDLTPGSNLCKFTPNNILRLDAKTRAEVTALDVDSGVSTIDEEREARGKPPLTPEQKAERLAQPPAAVAPNTAAKQDAALPDDDPGKVGLLPAAMMKQWPTDVLKAAAFSKNGQKQ